MKKIIKTGAVIAASILLVGCSFGKSIETTNEDTYNKVSKAVKTETVDNLQTIDSNILLTSLGLDEKDVKDYVGKIPLYNKPEGTLYLAIKPASKSKDKVEKALDTYVSSLKSKLDVSTPDKKDDKTNSKELEYLNNITKEEYKGYFIYVSGAKKDAILKILKERVK